MPFYEYECEACKFYTEVMQKITEDPLTRCPSCGKKTLKKLVSAPVFRLKGAGWYETDFKSDKEAKRNLVGADKEEVKAETKPESKTEAKDAKDAKDAKEAKEAKPEGKEGKDSKESKLPQSKEPASAAARRRGPSPSRTVSRPKPKKAKSVRKARR
jgi:putative FmdB family regulatory protein